MMYVVKLLVIMIKMLENFIFYKFINDIYEGEMLYFCCIKVFSVY